MRSCICAVLVTFSLPAFAVRQWVAGTRVNVCNSADARAAFGGGDNVGIPDPQETALQDLFSCSTRQELTQASSAQLCCGFARPDGTGRETNQWAGEVFTITNDGHFHRPFHQGTASNENHFFVYCDPINGDIHEIQLEYADLGKAPGAASLPASIGNFPKLHLLELRNNDFARIHPNVNQLSSLEVLDLSNNRIDQEAAVLLRDIDQIGASTNHGQSRIKQLLLSRNRIRGSLPSFFADRMAEMEVLKLDSNDLQGPLPPHAFHKMHKLEVLSLHHNNLDGTLPSGVGRLERLIEMSISNNRFTGPLPNFTHLTLLERFYAEHNRFVDGIPDSIAACQNLQDFDVSHNRLSGSLASAVSKLAELRSFDIGSNRFIGELPAGLFETTAQLESLKIGQNRFAGSIHGLVSDLPEDMRTLELHQNSFTGQLPDKLGDFSRVRTLRLHHNGFHGQLPQKLSEWPAGRLEVHGTKIAGARLGATAEL